MSRTHKVDLAWLHEKFLSKQFRMRYCATSRQAADIFTKSFPNAQKWRHALSLIAHVRPALFWRGVVDEKPYKSDQKAAITTVTTNHQVTINHPRIEMQKEGGYQKWPYPGCCCWLGQGAGPRTYPPPLRTTQEQHADSLAELVLYCSNLYDVSGAQTLCKWLPK